MAAAATKQRRTPAPVSRVAPIIRYRNNNRYESAQTTDENRNHWALADMLSARAANSPEIRRILRVRARHEVDNCPLAKGIIRKLADYVVGTGPRLQLKTKDRKYNRAVEQAFRQWSTATAWPRKLWQMRFSKAVNGEAWGVFFTNTPLRRKTPVTLDLRTIEADQFADPKLSLAKEDNGSDGITFDDFGNPVGYSLLRRHPGDAFAFSSVAVEADTVPAADVIHYFNAQRPGQSRGVPEITAALPYLSMRRRYILAVLAAAETAADLAGVIQTQNSPEDPDDLEPLDPVDIERRMLLTMPKGWTAHQFKAEQPTSTIEMFDIVLIREIGRCIDMPFGIAALDSSRYNFASGKLDHLPWLQSVRIEQDHLEDVAVEPTFERWYAEASRIQGYLPPAPAELQSGQLPPHQWFFDGQDLLDPRESGAKETGLKSGFETHGRIFAKRGEDVLEQWEAQAELLGLSLEDYRKRVVDNLFPPEPPVPAAAPAGGQPKSEDADEDQ